MLEHFRTTEDDGFTLIETLMVIIILGILAAIVVFAVGTTRSDSVTATCKTDVKSIQLAVEAIKTHEGVYPATGTTNSYDNVIANSTSTNGAVLKAWPGGTSATQDDLVFGYAKTSGGYNLTVAGKTLPSTTLNQDSTDAAVASACKST